MTADFDSHGRRGVSKLFEPFVRSIVEDGFSWGTDLLLVDRDGTIDRAAELAAILSAMTRDGQPAFTEVLIVWPPHGRGDLGDPTAKLKAAFGRARAQHRGSSLGAGELDAIFEVVRVVHTKTLELSELLAFIDAVAAHSAVIVTHGAVYRSADVSGKSGTGTHPEDAWAPHLRKLLEHTVGTSAAAETYVVVDAGQEPPRDDGPRELLFSVRECNVYFGERQVPRLSSEQLARWDGLARAGRLDTALKEVAAVETLSAAVRTLLRLRLYNAAGFPEITARELRATRHTFNELSVLETLAVADIAEAADADDMAADLLGQALPHVLDREHLERALRLATRIGRATLVRDVEDRLAALHPTSYALQRHHAVALLHEGRYREAAELLGNVRDSRDLDAQQDAAFWASVSDTLQSEADEFDARRFVERLALSHPARAPDIVGVAVRELERLGKFSDALRLLIEGAGHGTATNESGGEARPGHETCLAILRVVERSRLANDTSVDDELLVEAVGSVLHGLARRPRDIAVRIRLFRLLEPQMLGSRGTAVLAVCIMRLLDPVAEIEDGPDPHPPNGVRSPDEVRALIERGMEWLGGEPVIMLGRMIIPREYLTMPADEALTVYEDILAGVSEQLEDPENVEALRLYLSLAMATAPLGSRPDYDLSILRGTAIRAALGGRAQLARDLAEGALIGAGESPRRQRLAWATYADVHARAGTRAEALIAAACALAADTRVTWEQLWHESMVLLRLFRDIGLSDLAGPIATQIRAAWERLDPGGRRTVRIETIELQLRLGALITRNAPSLGTFIEVLEQTVQHMRRVIETEDELAPAAALLASALHYAETRGIPLPEGADAVLHEAVGRLSPLMRNRIELARAVRPTLEAVVDFASKVERARYAEDVGFDLNELSTFAARLLTADPAPDATTVFYAVEALADIAITLPGVSETEEGSVDGGPEPRLIDTADGPLAAAVGFSRVGLGVVALGIGPRSLVSAVAEHGLLVPPIAEPEDVFATSRLEAWERRYPYAYWEAADPNEFFTSTAGIGVSVLPDRAVIVADTRLQGYPPNLLNVGDELAGTTRRLAAIPSLTWLRAAHSHPFASNGQASAWIPTGEPDGGLGALAVLAGRLESSFHDHGITLETSLHPPSGLEGSDLVIVAAHGGVANPNRYFKGVQDDDGILHMSSLSLSRSLANVKVVVLFVCSGGRIDRHPGANAMVGLVKQLLDRGCRAVIAPTWPLETNVPPYWLPAFLAQWYVGAPVIDAAFAGNDAVRQRLSSDPRRCLAMAVFGDPLAAIRAAAR